MAQQKFDLQPFDLQPTKFDLQPFDLQPVNTPTPTNTPQRSTIADIGIGALKGIGRFGLDAGRSLLATVNPGWLQSPMMTSQPAGLQYENYAQGIPGYATEFLASPTSAVGALGSTLRAGSRLAPKLGQKLLKSGGVRDVSTGKMREALQLPAKGETSSPIRYHGEAGVASEAENYPYVFPGRPQNITTPDIGPELAANRTVLLDDLQGGFARAPVNRPLREPPTISPAIEGEGLPFGPLSRSLDRDAPIPDIRFERAKKVGGEVVNKPVVPTTLDEVANVTGNQSAREALLNASKGSKTTSPIQMRALADEVNKNSTFGTFNEIWNFGRSVMASYDLSAPLRQALPAATRKEFWGAFDDMFKSLKEKGFKEVQDSILNSPNINLKKESGLSLTDLGQLSNREEQFMSRWAEKVPILGRGVSASNRAYVGFLNKVRSDMFDSLQSNYKKVGIDLETDLVKSKEVSKLINALTGRSSLGKYERYAPVANQLLFSPRLIKSRLELLNPGTYMRKDPILRKEALKGLFAWAGIGTGIAEMAKLASAEVENDPTSSDFRKIKIGNTRLDPYGGFQQYFTAATNFGKNLQERMSGKTPGFGREVFDPLTKAAYYKSHPSFAFAYELINGKDPISGQKFDLPTQLKDQLLPMMANDIMELYTEDPSLLPLVIPAAFGMGINTYQPRMSGSLAQSQSKIK